MTSPSTRTDRVSGIVLATLGVAVGAEATTFDVLFLTDPVGPKALPLLSAVIFVGAAPPLVSPIRPLWSQHGRGRRISHRSFYTDGDVSPTP